MRDTKGHKSGKDWRGGPKSRESYLYKSDYSDPIYEEGENFSDVRLLENGSDDPGYARDVLTMLESTRGPFDAITFLVTTTAAGHQVLLLDVTPEGCIVGDSAGFPREGDRAGYAGQWNSPEQVEGCVWFADWGWLARRAATYRIHVLRFAER